MTILSVFTAVLVALAAVVPGNSAALPGTAGTAGFSNALPSTHGPRNSGPATTSAGGVAGASATRPGQWQPPVRPVQILAEFAAAEPNWLPGHRGVDFGSVPGQQLTAPAMGVVVFSGRVVDRDVVSIDHGVVRTTYEPATALVPVGHLVVAGEPFAEIGAGGHCGGRCVHWGAKVGERYINPLLLVSGYRPVLKTPR